MTATAQAASFVALEQRPLHLPTIAAGSTCPVSPQQQVNSAYGPASGQGPVYLTGYSNGTFPYVAATPTGGAGSAWEWTQALFIINPEYRAPALVRGQQIDGMRQLRFNGGLDQRDYTGPVASEPLLPELKITGNTVASPWVNWLVYLRLQAPGCYAVQVDGLSFSEVIVFQAIMS